MSDPQPTPETQPSPEARKRVSAIVDIGATSVRMVIAEIDAAGRIHRLESLRQAVRLGKDTFTQGRIEQATIRSCIEILKNFQKVMAEYGITNPALVHAVATSSVREAQNADNFRDRISIATGINLKIIDAAEESRLTFMAAQDVLEKAPDLASADALFVDVGGGSTEILLLQQGRVGFTNSYQMGTLRTREELETYRAPSERVRRILAQHIGHEAETMKRDIPPVQNPVIVAMSGDVRFAASQLVPDWADAPLARIDLKTLTAFADKIITVPVEKLVGRYKIAYEEAETLGPGLFTYVILCRMLNAETIIIPKTSFRDGLLRDMAFQRPWTDAFAEEVVRSAVALGHKYAFDEKHARHVADLSVLIFQTLHKEFHLDSRHELLLRLAGLVHEIGGFISNRSHHKHSMYLILNSDLFGLNRDDLTLVALIARYHRRALPALSQPEFAALDMDRRITVSKMAAILRVADALDRNHLQQVRNPVLSLTMDELAIAADNVEDLAMERMALKEKGKLFEEAYGLRIGLREGRAVKGEKPDVG